MKVRARRVRRGLVGYRWLVGMSMLALVGGVAVLTPLLAGASGSVAPKGVVGAFGATAGTTDGAGQFSATTGIGGLDVNQSGAGGVSAGDVYAVDRGGNRVEEFTSAGVFVRAFGKEVDETKVKLRESEVAKSETVTVTEEEENLCLASGDACKAGVASALASGMNAPQGVAVNQSTGQVFVTDQSNRRVDVYGATGVFQGAFGWEVQSTSTASFQFCTYTTKCLAGVSGANAGEFSGQIGYPAVNPSNPEKVLVADKTNKRIDEFSITDNVSTHVAEAASFVRGIGWEVQTTSTKSLQECTTVTKCLAGTTEGTAGPSAPLGEFATLSPTSVAVDSTGNIYAVDSGNFRVQKFSSTIPTSAAVYATGQVSGSNATSAPAAIAVEPSNGNVYIVKPNGTTGTPERNVLQFGPSEELLATHASGAGITVANGVALNYTSGNIYLSTTVNAQQILILNAPTVPPSVTITAASAIKATGVTLSGTVNPLKYTTKYHFEYSSNGGVTWSSTPEVEAGNGTTAIPASEVLTGLSPNTLYVVRLTATKPFGAGTTTTTTTTFTTGTQAPVVFSSLSSGVTATTAKLTGYVNPNNSPTNYHFEYGTTSSYGARVPAEFDLFAGSGVQPLFVSAALSGLQPDTTYHFRLVATSSIGISEGPDETFVTTPASCPNEAIRQEQGAKVLALPDCMALEQASPPNKGNQLAREPRDLSADGARLVFDSFASLDPNVPNLNGISGDLFVAARDEGSGWATEGTNLPYGSAEITAGERPSDFTPDLLHWIQLVRTLAGTNAFVQEGVGHSFTVLTPPLRNLTSSGGPWLMGASADLSHVYFEPQQGFGTPPGSFIAGDPLPEGAGYDTNLYVGHVGSNGQPSLELVARDREGKVWGANCGARLGGSDPSAFSGNKLANGKRSQDAISSDGTSVYFSTRPEQPASGSCTEASKERIMVRRETSSGPVISELFQSECTRVSPACATTNGDDKYQGASVDQTKVYFTTSRQLTNSDEDTGAECSSTEAKAGCDLYLYDSTRPVGHQLIQVSAGETNLRHEVGKEARVYNGVAAISADGSRVYFVAQGVLTEHPNRQGAVAEAGKPNYYTWDAQTGQTSYIGTLGSADSGRLWGANSGTWNDGAYPVPIAGANGEGREVGGDGHILLFKSAASLTPNDTDGGFVDIYRYNADTEELECVSCRPGPTDSEHFEANPQFGTFGMPGTEYSVTGRPISEDGKTIEFTSSEGMLPGDPSGVESVYLWREGQVYRLPGSEHVPNTPQNGPILSADGSTLAYHTVAQLLPSDGDSALDVYVARVDGGFTEPQPEEPCIGEGCQQHSSASLALGTASESFTGPGNVLLVQPLISNPAVKPKVVTNTQKLANALKVCRKKGKRQRAKCERKARKRYVPSTKSRKQAVNTKTKKSSGRRGK